MYTVSIEADAKYAWDESRGRFVEVCPSCDRERSGPATTCRCGHSFDRSRRGFFTMRWTPADLAVVFPDVCPHCLRPAERRRKLWNAQYTGVRPGGGGVAATHLAVDVPVCRRVRPPLLLSFLQVVVVFFLVAMGLGIVFQRWDRAPVLPTVLGGLFLLALLAAAVWLYRANSWLRFSRFDHRSFRLKARRKAYAIALGRLNGGRVIEGFLGR